MSVIDRAITGVPSGAAPLGWSSVKVIQFEYAVYGIDITPNGKQVWVSGGNLAVIDTATDEVIARIKTSVGGRRSTVAAQLSNCLLFTIRDFLSPRPRH